MPVKPEDFKDEKEQMCLRCNEFPALKDGSDDGEFYCKGCMEIRKKIEAQTIEENLEEKNGNDKVIFDED